MMKNNLLTVSVLCALALISSVPPSRAAEEPPRYRLARFSADITPPIGHPCMGGGIAPVREIVDPLFANGFVLLGGDMPIVVVALDWCEVCNDAFERWRSVLAEAAGTDPLHVLVSCVHQHDAPIADLEAQRILERAGAKGQICDLAFHEKAVQRVASAVKGSLRQPHNVTHIGTGQGKVEKVASNRRYLGADGKPRFNRMSRATDPTIRDAEEGTIDPFLKTLSFWDGEEPLLALSVYATHPMSYYGNGAVSDDFVGMARRRRHGDDPKVAQIYASGCSGNIAAGKYNDGSVGNRRVLADRMYQGMVRAWAATQTRPLKDVQFRSEKLRLEPRDGPGFTVRDLEKRLADDSQPFGQCRAARGLSWRKRIDAGVAIDVPVIDFGSALLLLLPSEMYVEYQLLAQEVRPDSFVVTMGYSDSAPIYIPTERAMLEKDSNLSDSSFVAPGAEEQVIQVIRKVLQAP